MNDTNEESESEEARRLAKMVQEAVDRLGEHFLSVRCFVTMPSVKAPSATACYSYGNGNLYAQMGQVQEWLQRQEARTWIDEQCDDDAGE